MSSMTLDPPIVVGLGSADRGDDAVGAAVARAVAVRLPGVTVVDHEDPMALLDLAAGRRVVVVVDAVSSGAPVGTVHWLETGRHGPPIGEHTWAHGGRDSTHAIGLSEMIELGRALGRLPDRLVVVGVEAGCFDHGAPLSPAVAAAVPAAADLVRAVLARISAEEVRDVPR